MTQMISLMKIPTEERYYTDLYFKYLKEKVGFGRDQSPAGGSGYDRLLSYLFSVDYQYVIHRDINRAYDGLGLRIRFGNECGNPSFDDMLLDKPCSVLEMMVALAIRMEEDLMNSFLYGDRVGQWFWNMLKSLGLNTMTNREFDRDRVDYILETFMSQNYMPDGKGGLFWIRDCDCDMRELEIWVQMCRYVESITEDHIT